MKRIFVDDRCPNLKKAYKEVRGMSKGDSTETIGERNARVAEEAIATRKDMLDAAGAKEVKTGNPPNPPNRKTLISFVSGHYKEVTGKWKGDSVWMHFNKAGGGQLHVNKDKVEYCETF
jgi:hypothetical protein